MSRQGPDSFVDDKIRGQPKHPLYILRVFFHTKVLETCVIMIIGL